MFVCLFFGGVGAELIGFVRELLVMLASPQDDWDGNKNSWTAGPGGQSKPSKAAFRCKLVNYDIIRVNAAQRTRSSSLILFSARDPEHFKGVSSCVFQRVPQSVRPPRQTRSGETGSLRNTSELPRGAAAAAAPHDFRSPAIHVRSHPLHQATSDRGHVCSQRTKKRC